MAEGSAFQDRIPDNFCFGCGPENPKGLRIKSFWDGEKESVCRYQPEAHQTAGPRQFLNGGIIATLIDCHCVCTATAAAYRREGRDLGSAPPIWYVTGTLSVRYLKPTPIADPVEMRATVLEETDKKTSLSCILSSDGEPCAQAEVVAIRVPYTWRPSPGTTGSRL